MIETNHIEIVRVIRFIFSVDLKRVDIIAYGL